MRDRIDRHQMKGGGGGGGKVYKSRLNKRLLLRLLLQIIGVL